MSTLVIGLTGGIGSGKTTISDHFAQLDIDIIDADIIAREVVAVNSPALKEIANHFGREYLLEDGQLNRALLRNKIFSNEADKLWLNNLLHPLIRSEIINQANSATSPYCILVAPLLLENNLQGLVNRILVIDVTEALQISRTLQRDTSSESVIKSIMASQISRADRLKAADDIFDNNSDVTSDIQNQVAILHQKYLSLTKMV